MKIFKLIISLLLTAIFALLSAAAWFGWHSAGGGYSGGLLALLVTAAAVGWYRCAMLDYEQATED